MRNEWQRLVALVLFVMWGAAGCSAYSVTSGRVDDTLKRVAIPFLENRSAEPNIEIQLTELIIEAIQNDNTLKVVREEDADTMLTGAVLRYNLKEAFTRADLQVDEYQVQILVELDLMVVESGEKIFAKKRITGTGNYILDDPQGSNEGTARVDAATDIVREVLAMIVKDW
jgi:hypothetical protein